MAQARLLPGRDPVAVTAAQLLAAAIATLPIAALTETFPTAPADMGPALATLALVIGGTLLPFTLFAYGQSRVRPELSMTQHTEPKAPTTRHDTRAFASPGMIRLLAGAILTIGVVAAVAGVAYASNGATQARAYVVVDVQARHGAVLEAPGRTPAGAEGTVLVTDGPFDSGVLRFNTPGIPASNWLETHTDALRLSSWDSTVPEQLLNRGAFAVVGLCIGVGALWLRRLLISIADGRPFQSGNAARIAGIGGLVVLASLANDILPVLGSNLVLQRLELTGASSPIFAEVVPSLDLLLTVPLLLALAEAFRRGAELAKDVEGLV